MPAKDSRRVRVRIRALGLWEEIRASYWFVPGLMALSAALLSFLMIWLDSTVSADWLRGLHWVYRNQPAGARALLSTVAGSMITVAGVAFSVVIVALSLASQQFGPRLLGNFMRDRGNQLVLGTFAATFTYCLLVLRTVRGGEDGLVFVPQLAITLAVLLALLSVGVLIYFIDHVAEAINVTTLIARVGRTINATIRRDYPGRQLFAAELGMEAEGPPAQVPAVLSVSEIAAPEGGYLQALDEEGLFDLARRHDLVLELCCRPGDFVMTGIGLLRVYAKEAPNEELRSALLGKFAFGARRTALQDLDFLFDQLVEVALRALSPAVNDPFTAMMCADRIGDGLGLLGRAELPSGRRYDEAGKLRILVPVLDLAVLAESTLGPLRRYAGDSLLLYLHLAGIIRGVLTLSSAPGLQAALVHELELLQASGAERLLGEDQGKLAAACREALAVVRADESSGGEAHAGEQKR